MAVHTIKLEKPFCEYNCDYPCSICLQAFREEKAKYTNPLIADNDEDVTPPWNGYTGDGEPGLFEIARFTETGEQLGPVNQRTTTPAYVPPPLVELKERQIVETKPITIVGPTSLKKQHIVIN